LWSNESVERFDVVLVEASQPHQERLALSQRDDVAPVVRRKADVDELHHLAGDARTGQPSSERVCLTQEGVQLLVGQSHTQPLSQNVAFGREVHRTTMLLLEGVLGAVGMLSIEQSVGEGVRSQGCLLLWQA
jgi:hypothetical protein